MCFFLPISPLGEAFRPEDEKPAYHGAYRGTVKVVKVVAHAKEDAFARKDSAIRVSPQSRAETRAYYDKSLPPFPPDANLHPRLIPRSHVYAPRDRWRYSGPEAGSAAFDEPTINVPGRFGETLGTNYDWQFETTKQPGLGGRSLPFPRGKVLGGTSALNFMTWNRGCREDYDAWEALGNEGWGWEGLLPFFKKSENFQAPDADHQAKHHSIYDTNYHGLGGPIDTVYSASYGASHQHWHNTLHKLGIETNRSHFSGSNVGVWTSLTGVTPEKRERCYSAIAYYRPNAQRKNLVLLTEAIVREIVLKQEGSEWIAKGARFDHGGKQYTARTEGEVILCCGSVSSPQLLELSGIGNPDVLKAAGISVNVSNSSVGENMQEHMMTAMIFEISPSIVTPEDLRANPELAAAADEEYQLHASGPRTAIPSSVAYMPFTQFMPAGELSEKASHLLKHESKTAYPYEHHDKIISARLTSPQNIGQIEYNFDISNYSPYYESELGKKYATMLMMMQYPFSRGSIHIPATFNNGGKKATSDDKPVIDPQYYGGEGGAIDFDLMVQSQRFADKIVRTAPLSDIIVKRVFPPEPEAAKPNGHASGNSGTDSANSTHHEAKEDLATWVRDTTITDWHPVGTCAMGPSPSVGGVVDAKLCVHGVKGLRVCDASIMPLQISAHLQATVYAIGEKGAELCKEDWEKKA